MAVKKNARIEDKSVSTPQTQTAKDLVWVRVLPYRGIGGVGGPGTVAQMERALAEQYVREGYVEIVTKKE